MQVFFFLSLLLAVVAVLFAAQNATVVQLRFLQWQMEGSFALMLLLAFAGGFLCNALLAVPRIFRRRVAIADLKRKIAMLERERDLAATAATPAGTPLPNPRTTSTETTLPR